MKKNVIFSFLLVVFFALPTSARMITPSPAVQPTATPRIAERRTYKRGAFEFAELYASRYSILNQENGNEFDLSFSQIPIFKENSDTFTTSTSCAHLELSKDDLTIISARLILYDLNADEDRNNELFYQTASAISALEFNGFDDLSMSTMNIAGSKSKTAIDEAIKILTFEITPIMKANYDSIVSKNKEIEVYSGNYIYSVSYDSFNNDSIKLSYIELIAKSK